ncbi:MAG: histidine kinase, partial [Anaerolineales bacterium]
LMPSSLLNDGFVKALNRRLDSVERRTGIDVILEVEACPFLTPSVELELYRIAQEALNNILLHAEADHIVVSLKRDVGTMVLKIEDNGKGFSTEAVALRGGLGIKNMRERAERLNSRLDVHSNPGQGTRVQISVEVPDA